MQHTDTPASVLTHYSALVQAAMREALDDVAHPPTREGADDFYGIMRYHLGWADETLRSGGGGSAGSAGSAGGSGKGLRGVLLMLVNDALGGDDARAAPLAAGIELLHNFSLVHDDIEDGGLTRRHRATVWSLWGAPRGINVGDGLYALAHLALFNSPLRHDAPERFVDIMEQFDRAALRVCEGQHLDMSFEEADTVSVDAYLNMIAGKSATLIAASTAIGARAAGASPAQVASAYDFGRDLGMAFQMQDDILGIWGDEAVTGKSAVSDIASRKKTLPVLLALAHADPDDRARLHTLYAHRPDTATSAASTAGREPHAPLDSMNSTRAIVDLLDRAGARDRAREYLRRYRDDALRALRALGLPATEEEHIGALARLFVERVA